MSHDNSSKLPNTGSNQISPSSVVDSQEAEISDGLKNSYGQILKSSAIIAGSSVANIGIGIFRTKIMALILGPSGFGLMGLYGSITDLTQSIVGMGVNSSGVRQIAAAVGSGETEQIARTAQVLRRTSIFLGLLGAVILFGFSKPIATVTFGNEQHADSVALLSIAVFFSLVSAGQGALIQGMRRIGDLAKMGILGTLFGTLISIPTIYFLHEDGIALSLVLISAMSLITSWWYRRKINSPFFSITFSQLEREQTALLKLGFAFMASGLMMTGAAFVVRIFIVRNVGFEASGLYQAAWTLGGLYVGFVLQSMGTDFYPRLVSVSNDNSACNRLVNEQSHISLLLAGPGIIATLTFAPLVIALFYSTKFEGAVQLLRWLCLGMTLRVVSWPMGFIIIAKSLQNLFIFSEVTWTIVYLGLAWIGIGAFSLNGAGIAFFGSYVYHVLLTYILVNRLSGFNWSSENLTTILLYVVAIAVVFCSHYVLTPMLAIGVGIMVIMLSCIYSINAILNLVSPDRIPRAMVVLLTWLGFFRTKHPKTQKHRPMQEIASATNKPFVNIKLSIGFLLIFTGFCIWMGRQHSVDDWSNIFEALIHNLTILLGTP